MDPDLLDRLRNAAQSCFPDHGVLAAYVFGSRVSGTPLPDSDLDVGYYLEGYPAPLSLSVDSEMKLASLLTDAAGVEIDLRNLAEAPLELRGRVLEEGIRIYSGSAAARVGLERDLLSRYHDYKDEFRMMHELRLKRTAERGL